VINIYDHFLNIFFEIVLQLHILIDFTKILFSCVRKLAKSDIYLHVSISLRQVRKTE